MSFWQRGRLRIAKALRLDVSHAQSRYAAVLESAVGQGDVWLEVGCGRRILPPWGMPEERQKALVSQVALLVGMDVDGAIREHPLLGARVMALGEHMPFADGAFDLITANTVVEHLRDPDAFLQEVRRILKDGGHFLFHTPNYLHHWIFLSSMLPDAAKEFLAGALEDRHEKDVFPTWYRLNTTGTIRRRASRCGLEVETLRVVGSSGPLRSLGPLGWLECVLMKLTSALSGGRYDSSLIVILRKPAAG